MTKEIKTAIIQRPKFGVGDRGSVVLTFDAYTSESSAALQVIGVEDAVKILEDAEVSDVSKLNGLPCWVEQGDGMIIFKKMWKGWKVKN